MAIELSAEALKAQTELTDAHSGLTTAKSGLDGIDKRLTTIDSQINGIQGRQQEEIGLLEEAKLKDILGIYDPRLQNVIALSLGNEDLQLPANPDIEACQRIAELDAAIKGSAGQPITVINPSKEWVDFAVLEESDPEFSIEAKGLVIASGPNVHSKSRVELPTYGALAIDPDTGTSPAIDGNRELYAREHRIDGISRPIIDDPLTTKAVLPGEKAEDYQEEDEQTTLVLIGYNHLHDVLNDIFEIKADTYGPAATEDDREESSRTFRLIDLTIEQLKKKGVEFDPDFIDGYLLYRINILEKAGENEDEAKDPYRQQVLESLWKKYEELHEAGWLK
jgi:hypothetical protein